MPLGDVRKYLTPDTTPTSNDETILLFERANATQSALRIMNDELGCEIPEISRGTSIKIFCPYHIEHSDQNDQNCRYYWESDHAYCFAVHGVIDPVFLRSMMWSCSRRRAAEKMLEQAGLGSPTSWRERLAEAKADFERPRVRPASHTYAAACLVAALRQYPEYITHQYDAPVREIIAKAQDAFNPDWDMDGVLAWTDRAVSQVLLTIGQTTS